MQSKNKENDMTSFLRNRFILNVKKYVLQKNLEKKYECEVFVESLLISIFAG